MASIATVSFLRIDEGEQRPTEQVEDVTRPGVDGVALRRMGIRGETFVLNCIADYATEATFQAAYTALRALAGKVVSWINNEGTTLNNLGVTRVRLVRKQKIRGAVGGLAGTSGTLIATFGVEAIDVDSTA